MFLSQTCDFRIHSPFEQVASSGPHVTKGNGGGVSAETKEIQVTTYIAEKMVRGMVSVKAVVSAKWVVACT